MFRYHLPLVFQVIRYADKRLIEEFPFLNESSIVVHFNSKKKRNIIKSKSLGK
ncbi:MAG: hypothetical protein JSV23_07915 [Promethearchaeota archaeon]|nr:MAG: hypothetical protein JSV23_07915 [Candidatus Lokiarchaeota archaeon]